MINKLLGFYWQIIIKIFKKKDIDYNSWIFSSSDNMKFNYNSKYFFEYIILNTDIDAKFVINDDELKKDLELKYGEEYFIKSNNYQGIKKILMSGVWITSAGLPIYGFKYNKERLIVNLWHGVPLKKICLLENNRSKTSDFIFKYLFSKNYSLVLSTSKNLVNVMQRSFCVSREKIFVSGQPRNDVLFNNRDSDFKLTRLFPKAPDYNKTILYAPTYREYGKTKLFPFKDNDFERLNNYLEKNKIIIFIKAHQSELTTGFNNMSRIILIDNKKIPDVMDIIKEFDLLITDYSSIYIDYLLLDRPIIFLPYDINKYQNHRGFNFDYFDVTPGPKPSTMECLMNEISKLLKSKTYYSVERNKMKSFFYDNKSVSSVDIYEKIVYELEHYK